MADETSITRKSSIPTDLKPPRTMGDSAMLTYHIATDVLLQNVAIAAALRALLDVPAIQDSAAAASFKKQVEDLQERQSATFQVLQQLALAATEGGKK